MDWEYVADIMHKGGTIIGTARCAEMLTVEGRMDAAFNLVKLGISSLVVIGGDGSLTGANRFKLEWQQLVSMLVDNGRLSQPEADVVPHLSIVGMVGSIDNDMCCFDSTIGCDTALHRIVDACDSLITTAQSHQRTFIVEVMGRNCGWLAVMAAIAVGADWVFCPESPPDVEDWESALCSSIEKRRTMCNYSLIIVSEGATDRVRRPITAKRVKPSLLITQHFRSMRSMRHHALFPPFLSLRSHENGSGVPCYRFVMNLLAKRLGHDARLTRLGHVQRGGAPSAFDRIQGSRVGAEAALAILNADSDTPSRIVGYGPNGIIQVGLTYAVDCTTALGCALERRDYDTALRMRDIGFRSSLNIYVKVRQKAPAQVPDKPFRVCIVHAGTPAAGMNSVAKFLVRFLINSSYTVMGAVGGFPGMAEGKIETMSWSSVAQWTGKGGCELGTAEGILPDQLAAVEATIQKFKISSVIVIGGHHALMSVVEMCKARADHPALRIPMCAIPVTIRNNLPGTDFSVGMDTALNAIVEAIDTLKCSAASSRERMFLVEVMGGFCGQLAVYAGLASGVDAAYIHEDIISLEVIKDDIRYLESKFASGMKRAVILRNEKCSKNFDMNFMQAVFEQEAASFTVRNNVLGHVQFGYAPSPLDRVYASRLAFRACLFVVEQMKRCGQSPGSCAVDDGSYAMIGVKGANEVATPVFDLMERYDPSLGRTHSQPVMEALKPLVRLLEFNNSDKWADDIEYTTQAEVVADDVYSETPVGGADDDGGNVSLTGLGINRSISTL